VLAENPSAPLSVTCHGETKTIEAGSGLRRVTFSFADSLERVSLTLTGTANIYGVVFDGKHGVQMDNVPMRGCSGTVFTLISSYLLRDYFKYQNVKLVILQYGGNSVPYISGQKSAHTYADQIRRQIRHVQELAPDAKVLFIGPSDMSTRIDGEWRTYPKLPLVVDSLRAAANDMGAAYWDLYKVMGGYNSMAQWCESSPLLAGSDHIHFTPRGAERVGNLFCKSLKLYYDYYHWRKNK
jgi:lysophospholipase L1-like esterase